MAPTSLRGHEPRRIILRPDYGEPATGGRSLGPPTIRSALSRGPTWPQ